MVMSKDIFYDKDIREPLFDFLEDSFGKVRYTVTTDWILRGAAPKY